MAPLAAPRARRTTNRQFRIPHAASRGQVAQLVEQQTENPRVGGSIPPLATIQSMGYMYSNPMLGWIVREALYTGMRQSEIQTRTLNQVDLNRRIARLKDTKNGSPRLVPLTRLAVKILRAAIENPLRPKDPDLIFFGEVGRHSQVTSRCRCCGVSGVGVSPIRAKRTGCGYLNEGTF